MEPAYRDAVDGRWPWAITSLMSPATAAASLDHPARDQGTRSTNRYAHPAPEPSVSIARPNSTPADGPSPTTSSKSEPVSKPNDPISPNHYDRFAIQISVHPQNKLTFDQGRDQVHHAARREEQERIWRRPSASSSG